MKIGISLPKEIVDWLAKRKSETGIPVSRTIADAVRALRAQMKLQNTK